MPFLPGDSLLFIVGAMAGAGLLNPQIAVAVLLVAAILGDQCNYSIGRYFGPKVFKWENSRFFNKKAFDQAHAFYERYGGVTIILARFMPFIRTFAPFVAGVAEMTRSKFTFFNVVGALIWVLGIVTAGYFFGNMKSAGQPRENHLGPDPGAWPDRHLRRLARGARAAVHAGPYPALRPPLRQRADTGRRRSCPAVPHAFRAMRRPTPARERR